MRTWKNVRLSSLFLENTTRNSDFAVKQAFQFYFGTIVPKKEYELTDDLIETYRKYTVIKVGDIVINGLNLNYDFVSQRVGLAEDDGIITSAYIVLRPRVELNIKYYCYFLKALDAHRVFHGMGTGIRLTLSYKDLKNYPLPVPPLSEQNQIVRFLDYKVSRIDKLISIRQRQITELEDLKKTIISKAVTKGLNPDVPMKGSGAKWIGDIPAEWEVVKLKRICTMKSGTNLVSEQINTSVGAYLVFGGNGIRGYYNEYNIDGDYILIGRQGALCGNVHKVSGKIWATDHAVITKIQSNVNINYAYYLLLDMNLNQYSSDTAAQPGLSVNVIKNLTTIIPPLPEQNQIAAYLDKKCAQIDKAISNTQRQIAELTDLKARLISDAVTGKIDIRGITIND